MEAIIFCGIQASGKSSFYKEHFFNSHARISTKTINHLSTAQKNELLFEHGINFNELPSWQKRGIGIYWGETEKEGLNPVTGKTTLVQRRVLIVNDTLPMKDEYSAFIEKLLNDQGY